MVPSPTPWRVGLPAGPRGGLTICACSPQSRFSEGTWKSTPWSFQPARGRRTEDTEHTGCSALPRLWKPLPAPVTLLTPQDTCADLAWAASHARDTACPSRPKPTPHPQNTAKAGGSTGASAGALPRPHGPALLRVCPLAPAHSGAPGRAQASPGRVQGPLHRAPAAQPPARTGHSRPTVAPAGHTLTGARGGGVWSV